MAADRDEETDHTADAARRSAHREKLARETPEPSFGSERPTEEPVSWGPRRLSMPDTWLQALIGSLVLSGVHGLTPALERIQKPERRLLGSFAGGISLAYVFLYLLFRLAKYGSLEIHRLLPLGPDALETMFILLLVALTTAYLLHVRFLKAPTCVANYRGTAAFLILYNLLAGAALVEEAERGWLKMGFYVVAIGLHLLFNDRFLLHLCPSSHRGAWRLALGLAPLAGCSLALLLLLPSGVLYLLLTLVTGATIINVMRQELPAPQNLHLPGFLAGVLLYASLIIAAW